jgi:hypothetical protein
MSDDDYKNTLVTVLHEYIGGPVKQATGIVEDKLKLYRFKKQLEILDETKKILAERGEEAPSRYVPLNVMIPLMEAASLEEDEYLREKWASLLANCADKNASSSAKRSYVSILENLTQLDAQLLDVIAAVAIRNPDEPSINIGELCSDPNVNGASTFTIESSTNNLLRLGLLYTDNPFSAKPINLQISALGTEFYSMCSKNA